jgi:hypothetical protein
MTESTGDAAAGLAAAFLGAAAAGACACKGSSASVARVAMDNNNLGFKAFLLIAVRAKLGPLAILSASGTEIYTEPQARVSSGLLV